MQMRGSVNEEFGVTEQVERMLANENTQFMIDMARELKLSYTIPTLALQMMERFFTRRAYVHYDRFVVGSAALMLASKSRSVEVRLKRVCSAFYSIVSQKQEQWEPFNEDKMRKIKDEISIYECEILRTLQFDIQVVTPHEFVRRECEVLFAHDAETRQRVFLTTRVILLDAHRLRAALRFAPLVRFVAAFLIATRYERIRPLYHILYLAPAVKKLCLPPITPSKLYATWLQAISLRENLPLSPLEIRDCIQLLNSLIIH